jgi:2-succinyl-6-hydroxy-2,4-cyclohexadiene-1-carboxylate synthase
MNIDVHGVSYYVSRTGQGEPLVLLHGFTGNSDTWTPFLSMWEKHFQCISVDIIGHGKTESPADPNRYDIDKAAKDLLAILDYLQIQKTNILGYSMGGRLALTFAMLYPSRVQKLILESGTPGLRTEAERKERRKQDEDLARLIETNGIEAFVDRWENHPIFYSQKQLPDEKKQSIRLQRLNNHPLGLANSLRGMGTGSQPSWWDQLSSISFPVLLLTGELDGKFCKIAEEMNKLIPNCQWIKIENAGHAIHVERAKIFGKIIVGYLSNKDEK